MATAISAGFAVALPPTGTTFDGRTYQLPYTYIAAGIVVVLALFLVRKHIPSSPRSDGGRKRRGIVGAAA
jgi:alpha-1,6-mannosyltransferase